MTVSRARTIVAAAGLNPSLYAGVSAASLRWPIAEPGESRDYSIDITADLADIGDQIASVSVSVAPSGPAERVIGSVGVAGGVITVVQSGGVAGRNYAFQVDVLTAGGETLEYAVGLLVDPARASFPLPEPPDTGFGAPATWGSAFLASLDFSNANNSGLYSFF
jgi:hypothetical protein